MGEDALNLVDAPKKGDTWDGEGNLSEVWEGACGKNSVTGHQDKGLVTFGM